MDDSLAADRHYARAMDFGEEAQHSRDFDGEQRMLARAQFHATMAVAARLAGQEPTRDEDRTITVAEHRDMLRRAVDELRGPLPKDDPDGLLTRVKELVKFVANGMVNDAQAGYIAVALYNNGLLRANTGAA